MQRKTYTTILLLSVSVYLHAQVITDSIRVDWSYAGLVNNYVDTTNVADVTSFGATGNGTTNDYTSVMSAINSLAGHSGIVFFPGSAGLYKNGVLVGGLGVSGDGVDQDDFVTSAGTKGFEAPDAMRADQVLIEGVRLPYFKFPRNPTN